MSLMLHSVWNRRGAALLCLIAVALSVALLLGVDRLRREARESFLQTVSGIDLIVGARSHPVQLLLYAVFHLGEPTQDISWTTYRQIAANPHVAWTIPLSLGDAHRGYRVVGTSTAFFEQFRYGFARPLIFLKGRPFSRLFDAVVGSEVALRLGYAEGQQIVLSHGTVSSHAQHAEHPFRIVGILQHTGTPVDQSVYISLEAIEAIHENWGGGTHVPSQHTEAQLEAASWVPTRVTAVLVGLKQRPTVFMVQRTLNEASAEALTAILPGVALQQLWGLLGSVERALLITAMGIVAVGLIGMVAVLLATLNERRREMALLRAIGATHIDVFGLILGEAVLLVGLGTLLGWALLQSVLALLGPWLGEVLGFELAWQLLPSRSQWGWLGAIWAATCLLAVIPAAVAMRRSIADGMTVRL